MSLREYMLSEYWGVGMSLSLFIYHECGVVTMILQYVHHQWWVIGLNLSENL